MRDSELDNSSADDVTAPGHQPTQDIEDVESTQIRTSVSLPKAADPQAPIPADPPDKRPVLGLVVVYSETHESDPGELDSRLGRVYPLRQGEILFVGRFPAPTGLLRLDGTMAAPTHCHLFPSGGIYGYISRRHLTVEIDPLGDSIITDYSRYGLYLEHANQVYRRKDAAIPSESHRVSGEEIIVLMDDLGKPGDADLADRRSHYRLHLIPTAKRAGVDPLTETQV